MTALDFAYIRRFLQDRSAIALDDGKEYLVETRLTPLVRQHNLGSITDLVQRLRTQPANGLHNQVVEAMVTTETSFFRDLHPFETLRKSVLPELIKSRQQERRINIWCAACSTGQEPYSLAMLIKEHFPELAGWNVLLLATDLSREVLNKAREGKYNQIEVNRGLPAALLLKHFKQQGTTWQLNEDVRSKVDFRELNLAETWPMLPRMDLVFVRNVMIYFEVETKKTILGKVARLLRTDGYLVLGGAETTLNLDASYRRVEHLKSGFYQQVG